MMNSMKTLIGKYPYFFNKNSTSNFYKSQWVSNERFRDMDQSLFEVVQSFKLDKRVLVWKEQTEPYIYTINFVANFPYLKTVTLYKNDYVIYTTSFEYSEEVDTFNYSYEGNTLNDNLGNDVSVIPNDKFRIVAETYEEYLIEKGFPENDTSKGDIYDHDTSLDEIGAFNNIPRKEYVLVSQDLYPATEPPYNNRLTEDDYHYIQRMLEYNLRLWTQDPVTLEVWKLYGIESELINREVNLLKVFDEKQHTDENGVFDPNWEPQPWEHKDRFCDYNQNIGYYFFIECSTNTPTRRQIVGLNFMLINGLGENITTGNYYFDIYIDDELIQSNYTDWTYEIFPSQISEVVESVIRVDCKIDLETVVGSSEVILKIRGCNDANIYVSPSGSDSNDGLTADTPVQTLQKACNLVVGGNDLIAVLPGTYTISSSVTVNKSCTILGCENVTIENTTDNRFFKLGVGKELSLQDLDFLYNGTTNTLADETYINTNERETVYVIVGSLGLPPYVPLPIEFPPLIKNLTYSNNVISYETSTIEELADLDGVIYDLEYANGVISYETFEVTGYELTDEDIEKLERAVKTLTYEDYVITFDVVGEIDND